MDLLANPFHVLAASPRDDRHRILSSAEERSLSMDPALCTRASTDLLNPKSRLVAEVGWLPGMPPRQVVDVIEALQNEPDSLRSREGLTPLCRANILAATLSRCAPKLTDETLATCVLDLATIFDTVETTNVLATINEERALARISEVRDKAALEEALRAHRRYLSDVMKAALGDRPARQLVAVATDVVRRATGNGEHHAPALVDDFVESYEIETERFLEAEAVNVESLGAAVLKVAGTSPQDNELLDRLLTKLEQVLDNWLSVARPVQLSCRSRGLDHDRSRSVAGEVRSVALTLYKEHGLLELSRRITEALKMRFAEVPRVADATQQDTEAIERLTREAEESKANREQWERDIRFEAEIGLVVKTRLALSADGIVWQSKRWPLDSITRVRWGGIRRSVNGIPSGTDYRIMFGNVNEVAWVETKREEIYKEFTSKLWRAVCVRLLIDMFHRLRAGQAVQFDEILLVDDGLKFPLGWNSTERVLVPWTELRFGSYEGSFIVRHKDQSNHSTALSYLDCDNVHILEAAMRRFWEIPDPKMSALLN